MIRLKVKNPSPTDTYKLVIRWSKKLDSTAPAGTTPLEPRNTTNQNFTSEQTWLTGTGLSSSVHPVLRASVISYPSSGATSRAAITQNVLFLNPVKAAVAGSGASTITKPAVGAVQPSGEGLVQQASCYSQDPNLSTESFGGYSCQEEITLSSYNFATDAVFLRLRSIYGSDTKAQVFLQNGSTPLPFENVAATIDVTGKSGDVFRRVRQTVPISNGISTDTLPEAAVVGGDGICKLYRVGTTAAQFGDIGSCF
jgi:hypothetical protein